MAKLRLESILSELGRGKAASGGTTPSPGLPAGQAPAANTAPGPASSGGDGFVPIDLSGETDPAPIPAPGAAQTVDSALSAVDAATQNVQQALSESASRTLSDIVTHSLSDTTSKPLSDTRARPVLSDTLSQAGGSPLYSPASDGGDLRSLCLSSGVLNAKQYQAAETIFKQSPGKRLSELLLEQGADEVRLFEVLARSMSLPYKRLESTGPDPLFDEKLVHRLTPEFCRENASLPLGTEGGRIVLATSRPDDVFLVDEVKRRLGARSVLVVVVPQCDLKLAMMPLEAAPVEEVNVDEILGDIEEDDVRVEAATTTETDLEKEAGESPVIRYVNYIIHTASKEGASDIHIEPGDKSMKVRFRIDGELFEMMQPPFKMAAAIISRLKIMANLDISERRLPQDGRIRCNVQGRKLDLRMSTIPSTYGEKVVLRILDTKSINVSLDMLGFSEDTLTNWKHQIDQPHGVVLVTGPTGSGKTTTLYASLRQMDKKSMNISTVEDPVEYHLEGITQTQTHEKIGMTFARALKALLRQDPDVILVGEIRDQETAHTAVQAALTGHLVLSTLHTNDAPSSITRLVNIGLEPFLLGAAVNACLAQRLVRRICSHCKQPAQFTDELRDFVEAQGMEPSSLFEGKGCDKCRNTGHTGRLGIYELLCVDDHLRDIIARNPNVSEFRRMCMERGMVSLRQDGFGKVSRGLTTVQEIIRATESAV